MAECFLQPMRPARGFPWISSLDPTLDNTHPNHVVLVALVLDSKDLHCIQQTMLLRVHGIKAKILAVTLMESCPSSHR